LEQTTVRVEPLQDLGVLLELVSDLRKQLEARQRRIDHLEFVLAERFKQTENRYRELQGYFETVRGMVMKIFLENGAGLGLDYDDIVAEFQRRFPKVSVTNLQRRIRELVQQGRLWTCPDRESGKQRFYLKLLESVKSSDSKEVVWRDLPEVESAGQGSSLPKKQSSNSFYDPEAGKAISLVSVFPMSQKPATRVQGSGEGASCRLSKS